MTGESPLVTLYKLLSFTSAVAVHYKCYFILLLLLLLIIKCSRGKWKINKNVKLHTNRTILSLATKLHHYWNALSSSSSSSSSSSLQALLPPSQYTTHKTSTGPYQFWRGHITRRASALQIIRQLHWQRMYFLPGGAGRTGCIKQNHIATDFLHRNHRLFSLSGSANLSTKIITQRELRLSFFLLSENNQRFCSAKVSRPLIDSAKMRSAKMISKVDYHFELSEL